MTPNVAYAIYMLACIALAVLVWRLPAFDFRGVGRLERHRPIPVDDEAGYTIAERAEATTLQRVHIIPRADLAFLVTLGALFAVLLGAAAGWIGPLALTALGGEPADGLIGARPMERLAQVVGAATIAVAALRMLRIFMLLAALTAAMLALMLAANYVLGRPLFAGFF